MLPRIVERLGGGSRATPPEGRTSEVEGDIRLEIFRSILAPLRVGHLLDLGTGHGKFAVLASELGWQVTAVDARTTRLPERPGVEWIEADVRGFPVDGYDCISILGLLYHLEVDDQLDLLARAAGTLTIVDTHVAPPDRRVLGALGIRHTHTEHGYRGVTFNERLEASTAGWGNRTSFWPTEASLMRQFHDCGFRRVLRYVPEYRPDRTFWVCS